MPMGTVLHQVEQQAALGSASPIRVGQRGRHAEQVAQEEEDHSQQVPNWMTAVKAAPLSGQPSKAGAIRRWAVEETGQKLGES